MPAEDFEPIARALYKEWARRFPERVVPPPPPKVVYVPQPAPPPKVVYVPQPAPPVPPPSPGNEDQGWWCYSTTMDDLGRCEDTRAHCNVMRVETLAPDFNRPCPLSKDQCDKSAIDVAARVRGFGECEYQDHVSCFDRHHVLDDIDESLCAPSVRACKALREIVVARYSDDWKVKSTCHTQ